MARVVSVEAPPAGSPVRSVVPAATAGPAERRVAGWRRRRGRQRWNGR
ncbi:hypothetical protein BZL30_7734 [Mycobacterium kansasii]|uniref:Uncharacterized protein n=1 Tax=Mycobacterium kansasii TaxID=1768 RepID=A0A1V3WLL2_MYCKA|nr:hypothetical protein BZL30_7734 [Mycobacterium kansasii]